MKNELDPLAAEQEFFGALIAGKVEVLDRLLVDEFILVDGMRGGEITKPGLLAAVASGEAKFSRIEPREKRVRRFGASAIVNVRMEVPGGGRGSAFFLRSR